MHPMWIVVAVQLAAIALAYLFEDQLASTWYAIRDFMVKWTGLEWIESKINHYQR